MKISESTTNGNRAIVQSILESMQAIVKKYGLELLQRYPNDLLVHDKAMLERVAVPGAKIAWMVGHCHTHLVCLGFNPKENMNVEYLTNLGSDDHFFVLTIGTGNRFTMHEVDRKEFIALSSTAVPYQRKGDASNFWLYRQSSKLGHIAIEQVGTWQDRIAKARITPLEGITAHERAALGIWCSYAITEVAGTLFVRSQISFAEPIQVAQAA